MDVPAWLAAIGIAEPTLQAAATQGVLVLIGLAFAAVVGALSYALSRRADRRLQRQWRAEKASDLQAALRAEVRSVWYELEDAGPSAALEAAMVDKIDEGRWTPPGFTPFIPKAAPSVLLEAIVSDLALLDDDVVEPTIRYYRQSMLVAHLAEDLRSDRFASLPADRKIEIVRTYFRLQDSMKVGAAKLNDRLEAALRLRRNQRDVNMRARVASAATPAAPPYPRSGARVRVAEAVAGTEAFPLSAAARGEP